MKNSIIKLVKTLLLKNIKTHSFKLTLLLCLLFTNCNKKDEIKYEYFESGELKSKIFIYSNRPSYKYIETYYQDGELNSKKELVNDTLEGQSWTYNRNDDIVITKSFDKGVLHGVSREVNLNSNNSTELLFLGGKVKFKKISVALVDEEGKVFGYKYDLFQLEEGSEKSDCIGRLVLKGKNLKNLFDLNNDDIDWDKSTWYREDLPDTVHIGKSVDFEIDVSCIPSPSTFKYLNSEVVFAIDEYNRKDEIMSYKSIEYEKKIRCTFYYNSFGSRCIRGFIRMNYKAPESIEPVSLDLLFYKQLYFK